MQRVPRQPAGQDTDRRSGVFAGHIHDPRAPEARHRILHLQHVVFASLLKGQFQKCKTIEKFSDSIVYRASLEDTCFYGYCPKRESLKVLLFEEKPLAKVGWLEQSVAETSDLPLQKFYYTIKEFEDDIRFILVAEEVSLMFVFRNVIHKCAITRNSLTLEDQIAYLGSRR